MNEEVWRVGDRVKVSPDHYGSGLQNRLGTVSRVTSVGLVEVKMDSLVQAGIGIVAFKGNDLVPTKSKKRKRKKVLGGV